MALTISAAVYLAPDRAIYDVTATANGDTTATIPHGMGGIPSAVILLPLTGTAPGVFYTSAWVFASADATNVVLTKTNAAAGGDASPQVRVLIFRYQHQAL